MAVGEIITCTGPEDLYRKAEDLLRNGVKTVFVARNTLKIVSIPTDNKVGPADFSVVKNKELSIA